MKKRKTMASLFAVFAVIAAVLLAPQGQLVASAAGNTYIVQADEDGDWNYQSGSVWDDTEEGRELYYLQQEIKDGDLLVVQGSGEEIRLNVHLANVTLTKGASALVFANGIDECYILSGCVAAINGEVANAWVYDTGRATFNNNVQTLQIINEEENEPKAYVTAKGSIGHVIARDSGGTHYEYYSVQSGALDIEDGSWKTAEGRYSSTPSAQPAPAPASEPTSAPTASAPQPAAASGEYDDVPKTGESGAVCWLLAAAAVCLAGKALLKRAA